MGSLSEALLDEAVAEVVARDPSFLERSPVGLASAAAAFAGRGVRPGAPGDQPLLGQVLARAAADAVAAEAGSLPLRPAPRRDLAEILAEDYDRRGVDGVDYLARKAGTRPLVLINAVGVPLGLWSRLLGDPDTDYRLIVVQPPGSDLVAGGMTSDEGIGAEVDRIERVLAAEGVLRFGVVGWCSGGRVAVELAARRGADVDALILVSTTFRGASRDDGRPNQFEEDVAAVFASVLRSPGSAGFLSDMLVKSQGIAPSVDEDRLLFRLPHRDHAALLTAPFASGPALLAYARRIAADRDHATLEALARISAPILAIGGAHDHVVDNASTLAILKAHARAVTAVEVSGAGHYAHDLQYPYVRMLIDDAMAGRAPGRAARLG